MSPKIIELCKEKINGWRNPPMKALSDTCKLIKIFSAKEKRPTRL
jgi:hypothetical protein